ncbi:MAG: trypsin-like peptidase domain-containing protein [Clostridia bacterium]|nr:trypsin-like peptidase domain-containing protein [Clostridia bacterium]
MDYNFNQQNDGSPKKPGGRGVSVAVAVMCVMVCIVLCCVCFVLGTSMNKETSGTTPQSQAAAGQSDSGTGSASNTSAGKTESTNVSSPEKTVMQGEFQIEQTSSGNEYSYKKMIELTENSVVEITTSSLVSGTFIQQYVASGAGSGIIVTEDGYIVTNHHVVEDAISISVKLANGEKYDATLIGSDSENDIAVIKIDATGLSPATFGRSADLVKGDVVIAIGNPLGSLGGTVTQGIISALERSITIDGETMDLLQTTAAINPGNSGGGLFNSAGELIGIVNAKSSGSGIEGLAFAIPIDNAVPVIEDLINYGFVRGKIMYGVTFLDAYSNSYLRYYGLSKTGTYIYSVTAGSDAEKAGLRKGDLLVSIDGIEITSAAVAQNYKDNCSVGDTVTVVVERNGELLTLQLTFTEYIPKGVVIPEVTGEK